MYTEFLKKFEEFREDSDLYTDEEKIILLDQLLEERKQFKNANRRRTYI